MQIELTDDEAKELYLVLGKAYILFQHELSDQDWSKIIESVCNKIDWELMPDEMAERADPTPRISCPYCNWSYLEGEHHNCLEEETDID